MVKKAKRKNQRRGRNERRFIGNRWGTPQGGSRSGERRLGENRKRLLARSGRLGRDGVIL